jgi:hypothetical protein
MPEFKKKRKMKRLSFVVDFFFYRGAGLKPSSKHVGVTPGTELWAIDVVKWFISDFWKWNHNLIVLFELWRSILKMDMFYWLGWRSQPCVSSLQLDVGCHVVIATAIPDAMLLPTDECFAQEVREPVYDGLKWIGGVSLMTASWI